MSCGILCLCEFIIVLGQLNAYVGYYKKNEMIEGDNPPVGHPLLYAILNMRLST